MLDFSSEVESNKWYYFDLALKLASYTRVLTVFFWTHTLSQHDHHQASNQATLVLLEA